MVMAVMTTTMTIALFVRRKRKVRWGGVRGTLTIAITKRKTVVV